MPLRTGLSLQAKGERHLLSDLTGCQNFSLGLTGKLARAWETAFTLNTTRPDKGTASHDLGVRMTFAGLPNTALMRDTHLVLGLGDTAGLASALPVPQIPAKSVASPPPTPTSGAPPREHHTGDKAPRPAAGTRNRLGPRRGGWPHLPLRHRPKAAVSMGGAA